MKKLSIMIKPASSLCNLRCRYCFYTEVADLREVRSFGIMQECTADALLGNVEASLHPGDQVVFAFQGGEPTLAGLDYFRHFVSAASEWNPGIQIDYTLQTNAMLLDDEWCLFLKKHHFLVGVSFDILQGCHDAARVDCGGAGTCKRVEAAISLLEHYGVEYNVLCTLTNQVARHPQQVWKRILEKDLRFVQFTPCLGALEHSEKSVYALTPKRFSSFYSQLFQYWYTDYKLGKYRSIKLFDDIINYLAFGVPGICGMGGYCQPQLVVESDGTAYPCDFYCLDKYRLGSMLNQPLQDLLSSPAMLAFHQREHLQPELCKKCELIHFCGGGCKRMQKEICCSPTDKFCGYGDFLAQNMPALQEIARKEILLRSKGSNACGCSFQQVVLCSISER